MKSFLTGLGIGAALGCALAPAAGSETRKKMKDLVQKLAEQSQPQPQSSDGKPEQETNHVMESTPRMQESQHEEAVSAQSAQDSIKDEVARILNTASKTTLRSVRGIGDATARRIVESRPYDSEEAVLKDKVLSKDVFKELKETLVEKDEEVA